MWPKGAAKNFYGSDHWKSKLNEGQVRRIKIDMANGMRNFEIAKKYKVTADSISKIRTRKSWVNV